MHEDSFTDSQIIELFVIIQKTKLYDILTHVHEYKLIVITEYSDTVVTRNYVFIHI